MKTKREIMEAKMEQHHHQTEANMGQQLQEMEAKTAHQRKEMQHQIHDSMPLRATEAIKDEQLEALQTRLHALSEAKLLTDDESILVEDLVFDSCIEVMHTQTATVLTPAVEGVLKLICISEKVQHDQTFAWQLTRKFL